MNYVRNLYNLLQEAIADGGVAAMRRVEAQARMADDLEVTFPTYAALAAWRNDGLHLIVKIAMDGRTVKSKSAALTLLTALARHGKVPTQGLFLLSAALVDAVNEKLDPAIVRSEARRALRLLIMSLPTEDLLIPLSQSFLHMSFGSEVLTQELAIALGAKWLRFGPPALERYQSMLEHNADNEPAFQDFFCSFPQLLDPMAIQVWSQPDFHGAAEPDFVIRRTDNSYLVVEIECPSKLLLTKAGQLSQEVTHAEKQAIDYESFLSERIVEARTHFPNYRRADCLVVIGMEGALTHAQLSNLDRANSRRQNLRVVGFDWLLERARTLVSNIGEGEIEVIKRHRLV